VLYLRHSSLESCIRKADFGLEFKIGKEKTAVTFRETSFEIDNAVFDSKLVPLVTELCALVEVAKNQVNNGLKSGAIIELSSLVGAFSSELQPVMKELLQAALQKVLGG
jgi:hypothetical protein